MMYSYYKADGYDFCGWPCTMYVRSKRPIRSAKALAERLYCEETGNAVARVYAPRLRYALAYAWYTLKGRHTTPEEWGADGVNTLSL